MSAKNHLHGRVLAHFLLLGMLFWPTGAIVDKAMVEEINEMESTWTACKNPQWTLPAVNYSAMMKPPSVEKCPILNPKNTVSTPRYYDVRNRWHKLCGDIVSRIRHEGECDSSWATSTVSMLSDRVCIESNGENKVHLSSLDMLTCCKDGYGPASKTHDDGCKGGCALDVIKLWTTRGIVSGGEMNSREGCKPVTETTFLNKENNFACEDKCTNKYYKRAYDQDKCMGGMYYRIKQDEDAIRQEIYDHGPVVASMVIHEDIRAYERGVYQHLIGNKVGVHYFKIIGWGVIEKYKYWLAVNTQGEKYGDKGVVKILRGVNEGKIEEQMLAGTTRKKLSKREELIGPNIINGGQEVHRPTLFGLVFAEMVSIYAYLH